MNDVNIRTAKDGMYHVAREANPPTLYIADVPILNGQRKAAGLGYSPEEALTNLVRWLAGAATDFDLKYSLDDQ